MLQPRPRIASALFVLACVAADASALGFGAAPQSAVLGQGLDFSIPLRLDSGEVLAPECVAAEVQVGESRVPAAQVRVAVEGAESGAARVRVVTLTAIDEPVATVNVALGCPTRLSRRFVLLADPAPTAPSAPVTLPVESQPPPAAEPPRPGASPPATETRPPAPPPEASTSRSSEARPRAAARPPRQSRRTARAPVAAASPAATSRLKLDVVEPAAPPPVAAEDTASAGAAAAAASAASAVAAAQAAASAAADRVAALEQAIAKLQADAQADRAALRELRQRAATADSAARWLPYLWVALALLAVLCLWLALRLRALQRERQQSWWNAAATPGEGATTLAASAPTAAEPTTTAEATLATGNTRPGALPAGARVFAPDAGVAARPAPSEPPEPPMQRTQPLPPGWREESPGTRDVTIEELIDLEQQAEFFIVLGQEDAAIDLLVDHLRGTGGGSPMPYLKLLEIYRRRGDREAYERTRARFNHRFNAYAPDWEADVQHGRSLEDYPSIVARLQIAWPTPLDAMAELESLLFRKTRGELFDMPAYRDVLFLYSLARDLLDREPLESGNVDVLLPISEGTVHTQPMSLEDSPEGMPSGIAPLDDQPTVPVDLDLTQPVMPDSLFGEPTSPGRPRPG